MLSWGGAARGAATGAGIGSIVPGIGTLLGTGVGAAAGGLIGAFGGGGGAKAKPAATPGGGTGNPEIDKVLAELTGRAQKNTAQADAAGGGADALQQFAQYFKDLIGGDPQAMLAATAADRGRVIDQYDTARRSSAEFGPRGGGSTAASALSRVAEANQLSDTTATARSNAATQGAGVAQAQAGLGISQAQLASMDLNSILQAILSSEQLKQQGKNNKAQMAAGLAEGVGTLLGLFLTRGKSGKIGTISKIGQQQQLMSP